MKQKEIPRHRNAGQHFTVRILFAGRDCQCTGCELKCLGILTRCTHEPAPECEDRAFWTRWGPEPGSLELSREHFIQLSHLGNRAIDTAHCKQYIRHHGLI